MANKALNNRSGTLAPDDQILMTEIADGVYAQTVAAVIVSGAENGGEGPPAPIVNIRPALTDEITGATVTIPVVHHEVHEGETFQVSYKTPDAAPLADNAALSFLLRTGARYPHLTWSGAAGGDAEILFYEDAQFSAPGAALLVSNMNLTSSTVATARANLDPTITNVGIQRHNCFWPGGTGGNSQGGAARTDTEWILNLNSVYMVRLINRAGNVQPASLVLQWYEEENN